MSDAVQWIEPDWPAPPNVRAVSTLRTGGVSQGAYASLNLGAHVEDDADAVTENRHRLRTALALRSEPLWLQQVHGIDVVEAQSQLAAPPAADAAFARAPNRACAILTADCLPVLFCDQDGRSVAAAHAGWRGLVGGVLETTVAALGEKPERLIAWLGPAIEQEAFEVGGEVRDAFLKRAAAFSAAFAPNDRGRWQADLYELARTELARLAVTEVYGGGYRCYADSARFFSYRRDGRTGRMATMVWLTE
jgi:polyphenol oxidase